MTEGIGSNIENKENKSKFIKVTANVLFTIFMIIITFFIFITAQSKLTGREPSILGHRIYIVESGSMLPSLKIDSMIIVKEISPEKVNIGDVISFYGKNGNIRVTHRVVNIENNGESFITRGDANNSDDPNPVVKEKVIGKVVFSVAFIGIIFRVLSNPLAIAVLLIIGVAWIVIPMILKKHK